MTRQLSIEEMSTDQLYDRLDWLAEHRRQHGRGRSEEATYVKHYCREQRKRIKRELKRRGLPGTRPGDPRVYGPGQTAWQGAR